MQTKLNNIGKNNKSGEFLDRQSFNNINEVRANIDSLFASIGKVNEKSIRVSGADKLTAEVKAANGEIHKMTVNLDSSGFVAVNSSLNRSNASALLAKSRACDRLQPRRER